MLQKDKNVWKVMLNIIYNRYIIVLADVIFLNFNRLGLTSPLLRNYIHQ